MEREITTETNLCDSRGDLNPNAVGWARWPIIKCNLSGRHMRKKRWNYWCVTNPAFAFSVTVADIDYIALGSFHIIDFKTRKVIENTVPLVGGIGCDMGPDTADDAHFKSKNLSVSILNSDEGSTIFVSATIHGKHLLAELNITMPEAHETLNVVVPWNKRTFQFTSKQNTMPAKGFVQLDRTKYEFTEGDSFACQDFGRGVWPYSTKWNWASFSQTRDGVTIGMNAGGMWTDGTGSTENGLCINGRLFKISDDAKITYNKQNFLEPWTLKTKGSNSFDLVFTPILDKPGGINLGFLKTAVHQCFGYFNGKAYADGVEYDIKNALGWSEEAISLW